MKIRTRKIPSLWFIITLCVCLNVNTSAQEPGSQDESRQKLLSLFAGEWVSKGLYAATKLEIADLLQSGPKSLEELATQSHSNPEALSRLLQMLAAHGIFEEVMPDVYANTDSSSLLTKSNPDSLYAISLFYGEDIAKSWSELVPSIQTGTPAFELSLKQPVFSYFKDNPERAALFQEAMKAKSKAVIKSALLSYDFGKFSTVCDVGGGYGQFIQAILQKHPQISGTVFELPEVIEKIKQQNPHLESSRCKLVQGDFFSSIPEGKEAYLLKSVIHDWDDVKAVQILKNCCQAMRSDSRLLLVEVVLQKGTVQPYAHCMDFLMLAITGGKERSLSSMTSILKNSGLVLERIYPTSTEFSILEVKKR